MILSTVRVFGLLTLVILYATLQHATEAALTGDGSSSGQGPVISQEANDFELRSAIVFTSTRHDPVSNPLLAAELYIMGGDGSGPQRLTNDAYGDGFPALSPDGKKIIAESNRLGNLNPPEQKCNDCSNLNLYDLFVMNTQGGEQQHLTRGSGGTWSVDNKHVAFHASASGSMGPIKTDPGAATYDSDILVVNVDDCLKVIQLSGLADCRMLPGEHWKNITNSPEYIDDDPDWSPDGTRIVFTRHNVTDNPQNSSTAEIYVLSVNRDGSPVGPAQRLTFNNQEERAPSWSPDGRIAYMCRNSANGRFEICVMNGDGTASVQLTNDDVLDTSPSWSPDGTRIVFTRGPALAAELFSMNPNGTGLAPLTNTVGTNLFGSWGVVRVVKP